ncbi:hypothetical protein [Streptomyces sp. NPDC059008]|uniref:hypothetical protein n=1 Tax=Streptomyces sp. NPDC059008 TaxID=3346693 RepID=UPI003697FD39
MHARDRLEAEAEDRTDFEQVLSLALDTPQFREALRRPGAGTDIESLRSRAMAAAQAISAAAATEYGAYLRLRAATGRPATQRIAHPQEENASTGWRGLLTALAVLAPVLSATASVIFLLLGYGLHLTDTQRRLADALVHVGWITAALTALAALTAAAALIVTAIRHRSASSGTPRHDAPAVTEARAAWRQALLERGMLPFLRRQLHLPASAPDAAAPPQLPVGVPPQQRRTRLGYASPDFTSPDFTSPTAPSRD